MLLSRRQRSEKRKKYLIWLRRTQRRVMLFLLYAGGLLILLKTMGVMPRVPWGIVLVPWIPMATALVFIGWEEVFVKKEEK